VVLFAVNAGLGEANGFDDPQRVAAVASKFKAASGRFEHRFPPLTLTVLRWRVPE
jgi:hypothetical protein